MGPRRGPSADSTARAATQPSAPPLPGRRTRYHAPSRLTTSSSSPSDTLPLTLPVSEQVSRSGVLSSVTRTRVTSRCGEEEAEDDGLCAAAGAIAPSDAMAIATAHRLIDRFTVGAL